MWEDAEPGAGSQIMQMQSLPGAGVPIPALGLGEGCKARGLGLSFYPPQGLPRPPGERGDRANRAHPQTRAKTVDLRRKGAVRTLPREGAAKIEAKNKPFFRKSFALMIGNTAFALMIALMIRAIGALDGCYDGRTAPV